MNPEKCIGYAKVAAIYVRCEMSEQGQWCGALLASRPGNEIECNLQKDHEGPHQHVYASAAESELSSLRAEVERMRAKVEHRDRLLDRFTANNIKLNQELEKLREALSKEGRMNYGTNFVA